MQVPNITVLVCPPTAINMIDKLNLRYHSINNQMKYITTVSSKTELIVGLLESNALYVNKEEQISIAKHNNNVLKELWDDIQSGTYIELLYQRLLNI